MPETGPARTIVITGASDGIGAVAARELAGRGHDVVVVGRSPDKTAAVGHELGVPFHVVDFADLSQVRRLADDLRAAHPRIDVLAHNAGGIMGPREVTVDGFEKTLQVNHLAAFLLTDLLLPTLTASRATVVQTSSMAARLFSRFDLDDLQLERGYSAQRAYGNAKLANVLFTRELHRRYADQGISAVAFHPGVVATSFASDTNHLMRLIYHTPVVKHLFTISPERGAAPLVRLADSTPGTDWPRGEYLEGRRVAKTAAAAYDADLAHRFWEESARLVQEQH